jgi:hypothetical protein
MKNGGKLVLSIGVESGGESRPFILTTFDRLRMIGKFKVFNRFGLGCFAYLSRQNLDTYFRSLKLRRRALSGLPGSLQSQAVDLPPDPRCPALVWPWRPEIRH